MKKVRVIEITGDYPTTAFGASSIVYRLDKDWSWKELLDEIREHLIEEGEKGEVWKLEVKMMSEKEIDALPELD